MRLTLRALACFALLSVATSPTRADTSLFGIRIPSQAGKMNTGLIPESSGLVQSPRDKRVFWTLSDSGNKPEIVPITAEGKVASGWAGPVRIEGVRNRDWEDIALAAKGQLLIADTGNNKGDRKDLKIHFVNEPKPGATSVRPTRTLPVYFEDQKEASPDFDCEAVFVAGEKVFFLTKHRSDTRTRLYRLDGKSVKKPNPLRFVGSFDIGGMVTAADTSPDGKLVAVLTYNAVWVFEFNPHTGSIFDRSIRKLPIFAWQAEGIAFEDPNSLLISNEEGTLYRIPLEDLKTVRP